MTTVSGKGRELSSAEERLSTILHGINNIARNSESGVSEEQREYIVSASAEALTILSNAAHPLTGVSP